MPVLLKVAVEELRRARFCDMMRIVVVGFCETEGMLGPRYSDKGLVEVGDRIEGGRARKGATGAASFGQMVVAMRTEKMMRIPGIGLGLFPWVPHLAESQSTRMKPILCFPSSL